MNFDLNDSQVEAFLHPPERPEAINPGNLTLTTGEAKRTNQGGPTVDGTDDEADEEIDAQSIGLEDDRPDNERPVEPIGLVSEMVDGVRQLPARTGIKPTVVKRIIRHLTSGEPEGRTKAFSATAVVLRYICDILGINHVDVPIRSKGAKRSLLDAIEDKVLLTPFSYIRTKLSNRLTMTRMLLNTLHLTSSSNPQRRLS